MDKDFSSIMDCRLCQTLHEEYGLIKETKHSFCVLCKEPIREGHLLVMPKRHVTQEHYSELSPEEVHDLFSLVELMEHTLNKLSDDKVTILKNSGKHSSQPHFHIHLFLTKHKLRRIIAAHEGTQERKEATIEERTKTKEKLQKLLEE